MCVRQTRPASGLWHFIQDHVERPETHTVPDVGPSSSRDSKVRTTLRCPCSRASSEHLLPAACPAARDDPRPTFRDDKHAQRSQEIRPHHEPVSGNPETPVLSLLTRSPTYSAGVTKVPGRADMSRLEEGAGHAPQGRIDPSACSASTESVSPAVGPSPAQGPIPPAAPEVTELLRWAAHLGKGEVRASVYPLLRQSDGSTGRVSKPTSPILEIN